MSAYYDGGDGSSVEEAVLIRGANSDEEIAEAEYGYIGRVLGDFVRHPRLRRFQDGGHFYDVIEAELQDGTPAIFYFDTTEHHVTGIRRRLHESFAGQEHVIGALDVPLARALSGLDKRDEGVPLVVKAAGLTAAVVVVGVALEHVFRTKKRRAA